MSDGPIKAWRESYRPPAVSTSPRLSTHAFNVSRGTAACGRRGMMIGAPVTCADCLAALLADAEAPA